MKLWRQKILQWKHFRLVPLVRSCDGNFEHGVVNCRGSAHIKAYLEGSGVRTAVVNDSWVLDVGAGIGTEDTFNEDVGAVNGGLLLELPIGEDPGKVEADERGAELIGSTVKRISNGKMAGLRTLRLQREHQWK